MHEILCAVAPPSLFCQHSVRRGSVARFGSTPRLAPILLLALMVGFSNAQFCTETCNFASDGVCNDGGPGSEYSECSLGTDCTDCGVFEPVPPPMLPPPPYPTQDQASGLIWFLLVAVVVFFAGVAEWKTKFVQRQWDMSRQSRDPWAYLTEKSVELAEDAPQRKTPALFTEFMQADRLDIVAQDTESQKSKAFSDTVVKVIKERRENKHYFMSGKIAKCCTDSDMESDPHDWLRLGPKLLQRCKETKGRLILLITPECKKVKQQDQWVGKPRLTKLQISLRQRAHNIGVDVREINISADYGDEKIEILIKTNVMMEKKKAEQFMKAQRVHVLSTQFNATKGAFELARWADKILDNMPGPTFCYNPNEECLGMTGYAGDPNIKLAKEDLNVKLADNCWLNIFTMMVKHASANIRWTDKKVPGKVFQLIIDGQLTPMQESEAETARDKRVEVVQIHCTSSPLTTEEQLRSMLMKHA